MLPWWEVKIKSNLQGSVGHAEEGNSPPLTIPDSALRERSRGKSRNLTGEESAAHGPPSTRELKLHVQFYCN